MRPRARDCRGFSLVEAMVAMGLVVILGAGIARMTTTSRRYSRGLGSSSACATRADNILSIFKNYDNNLKVSNFVPYMNGATAVSNPPAYLTGQNPTTSGMHLFPTTSASAPVQDTQVNSWMLIDNAVNWATILYNQGTYCASGVGAAATGPLIAANGVGLVAPFTGPGPLQINSAPIVNNNSEAVYLNIQRFDFSKNQADCLQQGSFKPIPISPANQNIASPVPNLGLKLTVTVRYTDPASSLAETCVAQTILKTDGDSVPPKFEDVVGSAVDPAPGLCPGSLSSVPRDCYCPSFNGVNNAMCMTAPCLSGPECAGGYRSVRKNPTAVCTTGGNVDLNVAYLTSEPGTVFTCELDYNPTGNPVTPSLAKFTSCQSFRDTQGGNVQAQTIKTMASTPGASSVQSGLQIKITGAPIGSYALNVKAIDSAQNAGKMVNPSSSPLPATNFTVFPACPAAWTSTMCPCPGGSKCHPDMCGDQNTCNGTMVPPCPTNTAPCGQPVYDVCGNQCGTGTLLNTTQCTANQSHYPCGTTVQDNCSNACPGNIAGTGVNTAQCTANKPAFMCGTATKDDCSNTCSGITGTAANCAGLSGAGLAVGTSACDACGNFCAAGTCVPSASPPVSCATGGSCGPPAGPTPPGRTPTPPPATPTPTPKPCIGQQCIWVDCPLEMLQTTSGTFDPNGNTNCAPPGYTCQAASGGMCPGCPPMVSGSGCNAAMSGMCGVLQCTMNTGASPSPAPACSGTSSAGCPSGTSCGSVVSAGGGNQFMCIGNSTINSPPVAACVQDPTCSQSYCNFVNNFIPGSSSAINGCSP